MESFYTYLPLLSVLTVLPLSAYNYLRIIKVMSFQIKPYRSVSNEDLVVEGRILPLLVLVWGCVLVIVGLPTFFYLFPIADVSDLYHAMYGHRGLNRPVFVSYFK